MILPNRNAATAVVVLSIALAGRLCEAADASDIVRRATAALKADWAADPSYACAQRDETIKGGKSSGKTFEALMVDGSDYNFPLAVNGQPLPQEHRNAELIKLKEEVQRRRSESPAERKSRIEAWEKRRNENGELLLDFPGILEFELVGEEVKDGRAAYVLSATPKPGVVAKTRAAKVLTGVEGKVWVDKETLHPMHIECTVIKPVPIYGVLASVLPGTEIEIRMTRVAESTWLIDKVEIRLNVSKVHFFKSSTTTLSTYTQYRPNAAELEQLLSEADDPRVVSSKQR